jgi:type VI secretion system protein ImpL
MKSLPQPRVTQIRVGTIAALVVYATITWMLGNWLRLTGMDLWVLRVGMWLLGAAIGVVVFWFFRPSGAGAAARDDELETALSSARARLASGGSARGGGLGKLPLVVVLGPPGSAKTTTVVRCGVEADLLAGDVFQGDRSIGPTSCLNLWYSHGTVFVEAGGRFGTDAGRWSQLISRLRPSRLQAVLTGRPHAPRAALLCFSCDDFLAAGAAESVIAAAREWREVLLRLARGFGSQLPVYVIFTKTDRVRFFAEYTQHMSREEAQQPLGTTLRWPPRATAGVYAEREFARVTEAVQRMIGSLGAYRSPLLDRDTDVAVRAATYEFPREFNKLSSLAAQFLVELCKPSQLQSGPVLRGFYFSGVRAVTVTDVAAAPAMTVAPQQRAVAATQIFSMPSSESTPVAPAPVAGRRAPQWMFLTRLFSDVLLRDKAAAASAQGSVSVSVWRRGLLASAAAVLFVMDLGAAGAWFGSSRLASRSKTASASLVNAVSSEPDLPPEQTLRDLDLLRQRTIEAREYGGGLFSLRRRAGRRLSAELQQAYLDRFTAVLLAPTRAAFVRALRDELDPASQSPDRGVAYGLLKAYLTTTQHPDRLVDVAPVMERWAAGRLVDSTRRALAQAQFEFYARDICAALTCAVEADAQTVTRVRTLLRDFAGPERVYAAVLAAAAQRDGDVEFGTAFPGARGIVSSAYRVPSSFTSAGWSAVQRVLANPEQLLQSEDWVVGDAGRVAFDREQLVAQVRTQYVADYVQHWRRYLASGSIAAFGGLSDAASKLDRLAGSESPLLQFFALASRNTAVDSLSVGAAFQPVHAVVPPSATERIIVESNQAYVGALGALQGAVAQAASAPPGGAEQSQGRAREQTLAARQASQQIARGFNIDGDANAVGADVKRLLDEPVSRVERLLGDLPRAAANARGGSFCAEFDRVRAKFPFTPSATTEATVDEVGAMFRPGSGALWRYYDESLKSAIVLAGTRYVPATEGSRGVTPQFLTFFNRAANVSRALWPQAGQDVPRFGFTVKVAVTNDIPEARLVVDGREQSFSQMSNRAQLFNWDGATAREARLTARVRGRDVTLLSYDRPWALFKLFQQGTWRRSDVAGSLPTYIVRWSVQLPTQVVELEADVVFANPVAELRAGEATPVFSTAFMSGLACVRDVMR